MENKTNLNSQANGFLEKVGGQLKKIFSFKFPPLLSFIITKDGKANPTFEEAMKDAKPQTIWDRIGMGEKSPIGLPIWFILLLPVAFSLVVVAEWCGFINIFN